MLNSRWGFSGFSVLELLLALSISVLLVTAFFSLTDRLQRLSSDLHQLLQRDENLLQAPLLLSRLLSAAGNGALQQGFAGIELTENVLSVRSDFTGPELGFPDGALESSFERVAFRQHLNHLQIRSGNGSFQPLLSGITALETELHGPNLLKVRLQARTSPLLSTGEQAGQRVELDFFLWNQRPNLFSARE